MKLLRSILPLLVIMSFVGVIAGIFPAVWNTNLSANDDPLCKPSKYYIVNNNEIKMKSQNNK